ncbi:MAG: hypothetical protein OEV91_10185 [Desulfobulbaceae bacterium]|nr:hypothetical protein [Desulfobulbaceae bacterium]
MTNEQRQRKIIPINFRGFRYKAEVVLLPGPVCVVEKTTMNGCEFPMKTVLAPHCLDILIAKFGFGMDQVNA